MSPRSVEEKNGQKKAALAGLSLCSSSFIRRFVGTIQKVSSESKTMSLLHLAFPSCIETSWKQSLPGGQQYSLAHSPPPILIEILQEEIIVKPLKPITATSHHQLLGN